VLGDLGRLEEAEQAHALLKQMGEQSDDPTSATARASRPRSSPTRR
jgi:hypothetical protein